MPWQYTILFLYPQNWRSLTSSKKLQFGLLFWLGTKIFTNGHQWSRHTQDSIPSGSSGLYEFTQMPFGLSKMGASFCHLMEMCLGDQQYLTLLFYLDDIYIFGSSIDRMLDRIGLVFQCLKEFNLKIKPKKSFFFQTNVLFLGHILSKEGISPNPPKISKVRDWLIPKTAKELHSFLGLASY